MGFTDYPFVKKGGGDPRSFPGHEEVLRFLEDFARDFGLMELIRFGHEVIRVERVDETSHKWIVEFRTRETEPRWEEVFEAVVICNVDSSSAHRRFSKCPIHNILKQIASVAKQVHQAIRGPSFQLKRLENHDNVLQHSMIECTHKDGKVLFQNGSIVSADVILHCPGYLLGDII
ncbi:flavin-containing monooxygenase FMO GS-OX-like 3 [Gossypium hirsutum]|uniref:Flavin-containing monooxygenase n=1 Tax=Gossypium hirsutum TaxID=3635 RepID=A0A1U8K112_GOSHI|nr:flavin-containing monooxygenase FMO GS-OX-like 3 [Gossypium hirsutum]